MQNFWFEAAPDNYVSGKEFWLSLTTNYWYTDDLKESAYDIGEKNGSEHAMNRNIGASFIQSIEEVANMEVQYPSSFHVPHELQSMIHELGELLNNSK